MYCIVFIFRSYSFDEMIIISVILYQPNIPSSIAIVLSYWKRNPQEDMSLHSKLLSLKQCLAEKK
jgi:hypothetical protein